MAGSSNEEIARQHAEALELLQWQPLAPGQPAAGPSIPLERKTRPVADRIVVQDMDTVTGPDYVASKRRQYPNGGKREQQQQQQQQPTMSTSSTPQPHDDDDNNENDSDTKANRIELMDKDDTMAKETSALQVVGELLPFQALAPYWSFRGQVDVTALQDLVRQGYNQTPLEPSPKKTYKAKDIANIYNYWDPIHAAVHNVTIRRPSHDQWGIPKIVLVFCDDFVHRVFDLPWWHDDKKSPFRQAVQPILDALGIVDKQIVRLLLASLPPGATIPIHSDSGEWVKCTHRVHVPVLVNNADDILFRCGPDLQRIPTRPGYIIEINNQSWHAVSNCDSDHRVHLILDYMDMEDDNVVPPTPKRWQLEPGEILKQTRRSVDRAVDMGKRPSPSFLILGAQKAGTTSLYEAMMQHPWFVRPIKFRETHCLDWRWNESLITVDAQKTHVASFFHTQALREYPSCQTGDSTPSYLIDAARVIPRLQKVWSHWRDMKFLVMLREPIQRCESHYAMVTSPHGTPAQIKARGSEWRESSLEEVLQKDLDLLQQCGVIPYWQTSRHVNRDVYNSFIGTEEEYQAWMRYLSHIPLHTGSYALIGRSLYALNLLPWLRAMDRSQFFVVSLDEEWSTDPQSVLTKVWQHLDVPHCSTVDAQPQNTRAYESKLSVEWKDCLQRFFEPHNERLVNLLASYHNAWQRRWVYSQED